MTRHFTLLTLFATLSLLTATGCAPEDEHTQAQAPEQGSLELEATPMQAPAIAAPHATGCVTQGQAQLQQLEARWAEHGISVEITLSGQSCGASVQTFGFRVLDADGVDVSGRSWPEVDSVEEDSQGQFTLRGHAVSCGNMSRGETIQIFFFDEDYQVTAELTVPIQ